jgi:hypothetical protein
MKAKAPHNRQSGAVLVVTVIALLVILGMAGLAIDSGHSFSRKTRLQNSVDAAALAAAMKLLGQMQANVNNGVFGDVSVTNANAAGLAAHKANLNDFGTNWFASSSTSSPTSTSDIDFCWSKNLQDFSNCVTTFHVDADPDLTDTAFFVRAKVDTATALNFIMQVIPGMGTTRTVGAVAVAGTIGLLYNCDVSPYFVCDNSTGPTDDDCSDGDCFGRPVTWDAPEGDPEHNFAPLPSHFFGLDSSSTYNVPASPESSCPYDSISNSYNNGSSYCAQVQDNSGVFFINKPTTNDWLFNTGVDISGVRALLNLIDINGKSAGANDIKGNIVNPSLCTDPNAVDMAAGNVSSLDQAVNILFGESPNGQGDPVPIPDGTSYSDFYDNVTTNPISYRDYRAAYIAGAYKNNNTKFHQRLRNVPVLDCKTGIADINGDGKPDLKPSDSPKMVGHACFFFPRKMYDSNDKDSSAPPLKYALEGSNEDFLIVEHVDNSLCPPMLGVAGGDPDDIFEAKIVLFQYYGSTHS